LIHVLLFKNILARLKLIALEFLHSYSVCSILFKPAAPLRTNHYK